MISKELIPAIQGVYERIFEQYINPSAKNFKAVVPKLFSLLFIYYYLPRFYIVYYVNHTTK